MHARAAPTDMPAKRSLLIALAAALTGAEAAVVARRRGFLLGASTVVRCRRGHLFTTLWIPGASLKSLRFGWWRLQRCPVGGHWDLITPVRAAELSDEDRRVAASHRDLRLP